VIVKFLGAHNAESKDTRHVSILIDDVLAVDSGGLTSELSFSEQEKLKAILLTHGHYDHIRGVPVYIFNNMSRTTSVFATQPTLDILSSHLVDGIIYPKFTGKDPPFLKKPSLKLVALEPNKTVNIAGYKVLPIPVNHAIGSVGFEITSKDGKKIFYTGDTGPGLSNLWKHVNPKLIILDVTFPNRLEHWAKDAAHLCPKMLKKELKDFHRIKGYFPQVILIHLSPKLEDEIRKEVKEVSKELKLPIDIAFEGKKLIL